jgi:hypothetical protein
MTLNKRQRSDANGKLPCPGEIRRINTKYTRRPLRGVRW